MSIRAKTWLVGLVWFGAALRFHGLFFNTLGLDEALFASWARLIAVWQDPLLAGQIVDKPPLLFYLQAILFPLFGAVEWSARMPNLIASLLLIPISGLLAWRLFGDEITAILAAAFVTFSPMAIQFSATAYTDPLLTLFLIASLLAVVSVKPNCSLDSGLGGSGLLAGILFGLATATKYQAWLFLPLVIGFALFSSWGRREWRNWLIGLIAILILVVTWEIWRTGSFTLFREQLNSYGGLRLIWSWELWPRLEAWGKLWTNLIDSPVLLFVLMLVMPLFFALLIFEVNRSTSLDQLLVTFVLGYFAFHWFVAIPTWDRYILPVLPIVGLVLSRFVFRVFNFFLPSVPLFTEYKPLLWRLVWLAPFLLIVAQAPSIYAAYYGQLPIGGNPAADQGASQISLALEDAPYGTVLYDHWANWQWRYHLFDKKVYVNWFPGPDALIDDLTVFSDRQNLNYLVLPNSAEAIPIRRALSKAGFFLKQITQTDQGQGEPVMILYRIDPE